MNLNRRSPFQFIPSGVAFLLAASAFSQVPDTLKYSLVPPPSTTLQTDESQGASVAMDGNLAVVGAPGADLNVYDAGIVKVYNLASATPNMPVAVLTQPDAVENEKFGAWVSISGTRVAVGCGNFGRIFVYELAGATPAVPVFARTGGYTAVAISGSVVVAGAPSDSTLSPYSGKVDVFDLGTPVPTLPVATIHNPTPSIADFFGSVVAIAGSRVVVGAYNDDAGAQHAGAAYVFDLASAVPTQPSVTFSNPSPVQYGYFGYAVAISGTRVVVGAVGGNVSYVYDLAGATPAVPAVTLPNPDGSGGFGDCVGISGNRVVVGAPFAPSGGTNAGKAFIYDMGSATPSTPVAFVDNPTPASEDRFGTSVAISGIRMAIGADADDTAAKNAGSVYSYALGSLPPAPPVVISNPSPAINGDFGASIAISGSRVVVGAPREDETGRAYVYDLAGPSPATAVLVINNPIPKFGDRFGAAVGILGNRIIIGAPGVDAAAADAGRAYIYDLASSVPDSPVATLNNPDPGPYVSLNAFGKSVAISGSRILVRGSAGRTWVYNLAGAPAAPVSSINGGGVVGLSGSIAVIGEPYATGSASESGRALVYDVASATPAIATLTKLTAAASDHFGWGVAASGTRIAVGIPGDDPAPGRFGSVQVFDLASANPTVPVATFINPTSGSDNYGESVAISGGFVLAGARNDTPGGTVQVFHLSGPSTPLATLRNPTTNSSGGFGEALTIDGTTVVVGAPHDSKVGVSKGMAYVFAPGPYSLWKHNVAGDAFASDLDDPDADSIPNIIEYSLLLLPLVSDPAPLHVTALDFPEGRRLRIVLPRDPARNDVTIEVQSAGNVSGPWETVAASVLGAPFAGAGYVSGDSATPGLKSVVIRDTVNMDDAVQRFMRVKVTR